MTEPHRNALDWDRIAREGRTPIFVARHGQTAWNRERRFLGRSDIPLDDEGLDQAAHLGRRLRPVPLASVVTSPLSRALQTGEAVARLHEGLQLRPIVALAELSQGELEGKPASALAEQHPEFFARWVADPTDARVPGGETLRECRDRSCAAIRDIARAAPPDRPTLIVTHQMVLSTLICTVLDLSLRHYHLVKQGNTALNLLSWKDGRFRVHRLNDTAHLGG